MPRSAGGGSRMPDLPPWTPIAGGVVAGLALIGLVYKMTSGGKEKKQKFICTYAPLTTVHRAEEPCPDMKKEPCNAEKKDPCITEQKKEPCKSKKQPESCEPCPPCPPCKEKKHEEEWCFMTDE